MIDYKINDELPIVFMFSGQGSQYFHMAEQLYERNQVFRSWVRELDALVKKKSGISVVDHIYDNRRSKVDALDDIRYSHPAIFVLTYSLTKTLMESGLNPDFVLGTSLGEITSLAVTGVLDLEDCIDLVLESAQIIHKSCDPGLMLAVMNPLKRYYDLLVLNSNSEIAAINYEKHFVISGKRRSIYEVESYLRESPISFQRLAVNHGFHSELMDKARGRLMCSFGMFDYQVPKIRFISCVAAGEVDDITSTHLWDVLRKPILFRETIQIMERGGSYCYVDVGASGSLSTFVKYILSPSSQSRVHALMTPFGHDIKKFNNVKTQLLMR